MSDILILISEFLIFSKSLLCPYLYNNGEGCLVPQYFISTKNYSLKM